MRKSIQQDVLGTRFPQLGKGDTEAPVGDSQLGQWRPCRKVLPDRSRAARDRANQKLVEYIVKAKGAEGHLRAILHSRKPSRWLKTFLSSNQYVTCMETYLEDEAQLDEVVEYLQGVCRDMDGEVPARGSGDRIRFILDVLLPEVGAPDPRAQHQQGLGLCACSGFQEEAAHLYPVRRHVAVGGTCSHKFENKTVIGLCACGVSSWPQTSSLQPPEYSGQFSSPYLTPVITITTTKTGWL